MSDQDQRPITRGDLDRAVESIIDRLSAETQAVVAAAEERNTYATAHNLSGLRNELGRRLDTLDRRTERLESIYRV